MAFLLTSIGLLLVLIGYWGPWVAHPAVGLVQNGFDLSEFVGFMPQIRDGSEPMASWLFLLPLTAVILGLGLQTGIAQAQKRLWLRWLWTGMALLLLLILIPPYPYTLDRLWGPGFRARSSVALLSLAGFLLLVLSGRWLSEVRADLVLATLALASVASPVVQFLSIWDALNRIYGRSLSVGWGPGLMGAGVTLLLGVAVWQCWRGKQEAACR